MIILGTVGEPLPDSEAGYRFAREVMKAFQLVNEGAGVQLPGGGGVRPKQAPINIPQTRRLIPTSNAPPPPPHPHPVPRSSTPWTSYHPTMPSPPSKHPIPATNNDGINTAYTVMAAANGVKTEEMETEEVCKGMGTGREGTVMASGSNGKRPVKRGSSVSTRSKKGELKLY